MTGTLDGRVPLLVTMDLEIAHDHDLDEQRSILETLRVALDAQGMRATIFATLSAAREFADALRSLVESGHEVGCHGVDHGPDENYRCLSYDRAYALLEQATDGIEATLGVRPRVYRGPFMSTSSHTQRALIELGYDADLSVCSRRIDLFNSRGATPAWLWAPRRPYRPSRESPFRRGSQPLVVVPLSGLGAPFLSGVLYTAGPQVTRAMFRWLRRESHGTGQPIVFLFHSYELTTQISNKGTKPLHRFYRRSRRERFARLTGILEFMQSYGDVATLTATEYVNTLGLLPERKVV